MDSSDALAAAVVVGVVGHLSKLCYDLARSRKNGGPSVPAWAVELTKALKAITKQLEGLQSQSKDLHEAHLGPRAIDPKGGLRWHNTEVVDCMNHLASKMDGQTDAIVRAIEESRPA